MYKYAAQLQPTPFTPPRTEQEEADRLVELVSSISMSSLSECKIIAQVFTSEKITSLQLRGLSTTFEEKVLTILKGMWLWEWQSYKQPIKKWYITLEQQSIVAVNVLATVIVKKILNQLDLVTLLLFVELELRNRKQQYTQHFARQMKDGILSIL